VPTYEYACTECGHRFEAVQSFSDDALRVCPECGGVLRKVYGSVGVVFKGSGFYRNDSRSNSKSAAAAAKGSSDAGSGSGSGGSTEPASSPSTSSGAPAPAAAPAGGSTSKASPSKAAAS
jgi:putative FmdB family regulatory protein